MKKQKGRYRPYHMMLMLTSDEKDFIASAARALGANNSALVRTAAIKTAEAILGEQFKEEQHGDHEKHNGTLDQRQHGKTVR